MCVYSFWSFIFRFSVAVKSDMTCTKDAVWTATKRKTLNRNFSKKIKFYGLDKSVGAVFNRLLLFFLFNITLPHAYDLTHIENKRKTAFQIHHLKLATHFGPCFSSLTFPP